MSPPDFLNHLLNFMAPALWVALLVTLFARFFMNKQVLAGVLLKSIAINFVVCCGVLVAGLVFFGRDGKMLTYAALVVGCASSQWVLQRAWRV